MQTVQPLPAEERSSILKKKVPAFLCLLLMIFLAAALAVTHFIEAETPIWFSAVFEIVLILVPCLLVLLFSRSSLPMAPMSGKRIFYVAGMGIFGYALSLPLNANWALIWTSILQIDETSAFQNIELISKTPLWVLILVIALTPAICEEFFFRGMLMKSYSYYPAAAVCMSAALFALLQYDITRLVPTFYLGLIMGWAVTRTQNLTAGMILHFINNAFSVIYMKLVYPLLGLSETSGQGLEGLFDYLQNNPAATGSLLIMELALFALVGLCVPLFILFLMRFIRDTADDTQKLRMETVLMTRDHPKWIDLLFILVAAAMLIVLAVITIIG